MASKSQLDDLVLVDTWVKACSAFLDDPLHVRTFGANNSSSDLELSFVGNLNFIFARIFDSLVLFALIWIIVWRCIRSRLVWWTLSTWFKLVDILVWNERLWLLRRHKWRRLWLIGGLCLLLLLMHGQRLVPDVEWWGWWLENWSTYSKLTMRICWHRHLHSLRLETKSWLRSWSKRLSSLSTSIWESLELSVHHLLLLLLSKEELLLLEMILVHHGLVLHHSLLFLVW